MNRSRSVVLGFVLMLLTASPLNAQSEPERRAALAAMLEARLQKQQPLDLSAEAITLTGDVLTLKGHVTIVVGSDTFIRVDEVHIDRAAKKVELIGNLYVSLGPSSGLQPTPSGIKYR